MIEGLKEDMKRLREGEPGRRFQDFYHYRQRTRTHRYAAKRLVSIFGGLAIMVAGVVLMPAPGPGWAIFFLGLGLLSSEFLVVARFMDWGEVKARHGAETAKRLWVQSPIAGKVLIGLIALICVAAAGYGAYYVVFGRGWGV